MKVLAPRNHGIRQYDESTGEIRFWEFDVLGGVTEGTVTGDGRDLVYEYGYGDYRIRERLVYRGERHYELIINSLPEKEDDYLLRVDLRVLE